MPGMPRTRAATTAPTPSSPRIGFPIPITVQGSATIDLEPEEVGGARDARVVVADALLEDDPQLVVGFLDMCLQHQSEVLFDGQLVLCSRGHDLGVGDHPLGVEAIPVE